jgi:hypothetical protein
MDNAGYAALVMHPNGAAHFGVWIALVEIASRCPQRGTLAKSGKPLSARDLSLICRFPEEIIAEAIERLLSDDIGWLEKCEVIEQGAGIPHPPAGIPQVGAGIWQEGAPRASRARREGNGMEEKGSEAATLVHLLAQQHPEPGSPAEATEAAEEILASALDRETRTRELRESHRLFVAHWEKQRQRNPHSFIPTLWAWLSKGYWLHPPKPIPRIQPLREEEFVPDWEEEKRAAAGKS